MPSVKWNQLLLHAMNILILKLITIITILIISLRNYILFEFSYRALSCFK